MQYAIERQSYFLSPSCLPYLLEGCRVTYSDCPLSKLLKFSTSRPQNVFMNTGSTTLPLYTFSLVNKHLLSLLTYKKMSRGLTTFQPC